ncbi:MAG: hypothetical protein OXU23_11145 [Candidatus Poribacteria bacterium]|nr:hypothetical protein [Candidatus Poribacteria bacterium]
MNQLRQEIKELVTTLIINESDVRPIEMSHTQLFEYVKKYCSDRSLEIAARYYNEDVIRNLNRASYDVNDHRKVHAILDMVADRDDLHYEIVDLIKEKR